MPVDSPFVMVGNAPRIPGCRDLSLIGERVARSLFSATSDRVGRPVTVTVFPPLSEGRTRQGFDEAAAVAQRLGAHPSVLTIHEWGHSDDGRPWIVTEPQPAESVDTLLTMDGPLEVERALQVGVLLAGALETAHRAGIVHGDLQPARLVFGVHGEPLLVETGLAAFAVFPGLGALNNPVRYFAPPEVLERTETTTATDVYSLAATVYALLAGRAPQQKPAEITDSNASLLLRILQMPVPGIDRPDLPPGLEDALRGPLSPSPSRRPQRAIDVAWLLQDVQRRAGFAVTEPVVLDLDDVGGGNAVSSEVRASAAAGGAVLAPGVGPGQFDAVHPSPPAADIAPAASAASPGLPADPWAPDGPPADPWASAAPTAPTAPADPWAPAVPQPEHGAEPVPPPTIFPFAEGVDDGPGSPADSRPAALPDAEASPWSSAEAESPDQALWPSSWPADQAPSELPTWATPPPANGTAPAEAASFGDDRDPIGGPTISNGNGNGHGAVGAGPAAAAALSSGPATELPPELDELPAWYTDPLPNVAPSRDPYGADPGSAAVAGSDVAWPAPAGDADAGLWPASPPADDALWPASPPANGDTLSPGSPPAHDDPPWPAVDRNGRANGYDDRPADAAGWDGAPQLGLPAPSVDERLPGAGDELRSLFGEVVRDPDDPSSAGDPAPGARLAARGAPAVPETDPLGPPRDRPPIDLSQLDTPLGPAPYLPARRDADGSGNDRAARLPRRHEVPTWPEADDRDGRGAPPRLPRADEAYPVRVPGDEPSARPERSAPRQVAPDPDREPRPGGAANAGPPALPLIILIAVVAVLVLGVAWLVITGDEAEAPASDRPTAEADADAGDGAGAVAGGGGAPTGVTATTVPEGIQLTWTGAQDGTYIVTVLSPDQPPRALTPSLGTSYLVPNVELASGGGRCFTVAAAPDAEGVPGSPSAPACTEGATIEGMQQAAG